MKSFIKYFCSFSTIAMAAFLFGCQDSSKIASLPEPVDLTMTVANSNLVMGESLDITFEVTDANSEIANEDFNIELSLQCTDIDNPAVLFEDFPTLVSFTKGEKVKTISVPVIKEGISSTHYVTLNAFVRSYKVNNPSQTVTISDYHYSFVNIKNNTSNEVREGTQFILTVSTPVPAKENVDITIIPKDDESDNYVGVFPLYLKINAGETTADSDPIELKKDDTYKGNEVLTFNVETESQQHPLRSSEFSFTKVDIDTPLDPEKVRDERYLYKNPDQMFVSPGNKKAVENWGQLNFVEMNEGDPHPNPEGVLELNKWTFYRAYEFHCIPACYTNKTGVNGYPSDRYPSCFADQNTEAVQTAGGCDNTRYGWITDDGYLRMITLKEKTYYDNDGKPDKSRQFNFGTSAFYANKHKEGNANSSTFKPQNLRIYPGMRIETRARIRGCKNTGMLPGIWLQGNKQVSEDGQWNAWPDFGEIDVMENNSRDLPNNVEVTFHIGHTTPGKGDAYNPTTKGGVPNFSGKLEEFNIYWVEWVDNSTVVCGINGAVTLRLEKSGIPNTARWPFTDEVNSEGLYYILSMMFLGKVEPNASNFAGYTTDQVRSKDYNWSNSPVPRMEIDWVRFYVDRTMYNEHNKPFNNSIFY